MSQIRDRLINADKAIQLAWAEIETHFESYFSRINSIFKDYTLHDKSHLLALESILDWLTPPEMWSRLNDYELFCLLCGLWGHDIGMGAPDDVIADYCAEIDHPTPTSTELLVFLRDHHAKLSKIIVTHLVSAQANPNLSGVAQLCGLLAHSHHEYSLDHIANTYPVGHDGTLVRPVYLAILIRLADILHCTGDRAPYQLMIKRSITNATSLEHWKRHQATVGIAFSQPDHAIKMHVEASDVRVFEWCLDYMNAVKRELEFCTTVMARRNLFIEGYNLSATGVVSEVVTPFISESFRFRIEPASAIKTLIGRNLYDDHSVVIRELLQNAIDACKIRLLREVGLRPLIEVSYDESAAQIIFSDNGIGMTLNEIREGLLTSCSKGFRKEANNDDLISKFGIGFLTVFLVAKSVTVSTRSQQASASESFKLRSESPNFPVEVRKVHKSDIGTRIEIQLDDGIKLTVDDLRRWLPVGEMGSWVTMRFNGVQVTTPLPEAGEAVGFSFRTALFSSSTDSFDLRLRSTILEDNGKAITTCGLSFQNLESLDKAIVKTPDVKGRVFNGSIPVSQKGGQVPQYIRQDGNVSFLFKHFTPFELFIKKPGKVELNLARNNYFPSLTNDSFFSEVENTFSSLIRECYDTIAQTAERPGEFANNFIGEFWLNRILRTHTIVSHSTPVDPSEHIQKYWKIWEDSEWAGLNEAGLQETRPLRDAINSSDPTLFISPQAFHFFNSTNSLQSVLSAASRAIGKHHRLLHPITPLRLNQEPASMLISMCTNVAFLDVTGLGLAFPPLPIFCFQPIPRIPTSYSHAAALFGSAYPITGYTANSRITGFGGSNGHRLFINLLADANITDKLHPIFDRGKYQDLTFAHSPRRNIFEKLRSLGIPDEYLTEKHVDPILSLAFRQGPIAFL